MTNRPLVPLVGMYVMPSGPTWYFDDYDCDGRPKRWLAIGASATCDIVIDEPTVSGLHCRIARIDGRVIVQRIESKNSVKVNRVRMRCGMMEVRPGDVLQIGKSRIAMLDARLLQVASNRARITACSINEYLAMAVEYYGSRRRAAAIRAVPLSTFARWLRLGRHR